LACRHNHLSSGSWVSFIFCTRTLNSSRSRTEQKEGRLGSPDLPWIVVPRCKTGKKSAAVGANLPRSDLFREWHRASAFVSGEFGSWLRLRMLRDTRAIVDRLPPTVMDVPSSDHQGTGCPGVANDVTSSPRASRSGTGTPPRSLWHLTAIQIEAFDQHSWLSRGLAVRPFQRQSRARRSQPLSSSIILLSAIPDESPTPPRPVG
jgi:hypothetical protein